MVVFLLLIFVRLDSAFCNNSIGVHKKPEFKIDKEHFNKIYGRRLENFKSGRPVKIDDLSRRGSPWPWYEQAKVQYKDDKQLHKETKREHKDYQAEYAKQFQESMRIRQETERINAETDRESAVLKIENGQNNGTADSTSHQEQQTQTSSNNGKTRKNILLSEKDSKQFLKTP